MKNCKALCLAFALLLGLLSGCQGTQKPQEPADGNPQLNQAAQELLAESGQPSDPQQTQQVAQDLQLLSGTVLSELVRVEEITQEGVTYAIDYPAAGVTDLLQVAAQEDGSTTVTITEGEKTDVFTYQTNGKVLLNGETLSGCDLIAGEEAPEQDGLVYQVEAAPAEQISQTADRAENIVAGTDYTFLNLAAQVHTVSLPAPAEELTLSALLHVLGSHGANRLQQIMANPAAAGLVPAMGQALDGMRDRAAAVFRSKGTQDPESFSYMIFRYAAADQGDAAASYLYVIDAYANRYWYGGHFLWGILETGQEA